MRREERKKGKKKKGKKKAEEYYDVTIIIPLLSSIDIFQHFFIRGAAYLVSHSIALISPPLGKRIANSLSLTLKYFIAISKHYVGKCFILACLVALVGLHAAHSALDVEFEKI